MNRIDRLTAILIKLQSRKFLPLNEIADHFDISERTVFRDIKALGEAGVPLGFEQGKGYFIVEGYNIPPVMFTKEEAGAILLAGKLLEKQSDKSLLDHFDQALLKIRAVLKSSEKDYLHDLEQHIEIVHPKIPKAEDFPDKFLTEIKNALVANRVLSFEYYANYSDTFSTRQVEPMGICHYGNHWHLIAYCRMRKGVRDFRTDRIMKLTTLDDQYDASVHGDFKEHVFDFNSAKDFIEAQIRFDHQVARYVSEQKYYYGYISEEKIDDGIVMTFMVSDYHYFARWLLQYTRYVDILDCEPLSNVMNELIEELSRHYLQLQTV